MNLFLFNFLGPEMLILFLAALIIVPFIYYIIMLQQTMKIISVENRKMPPHSVWLLLIPIIGSFYHFYVVIKLGESLALEFRDRNIPSSESQPGTNLGITMCLLFLASVIPYLGFLFAIAGLICWIMYWGKINSFKNLLLRNPLTV